MADYATETEVRLRHGMFKREQYSESGGEVSVDDTTINLNNDTTLIIQIKKRNGATVTTLVETTDYTLYEPRTIKLTAAVVADDIFYIKYGIGPDSDTIGYCLEDATDLIKAFLEDRYGETEVTSWESSPPTVIKHWAVGLAGYDAERAMLRQAHKYDPDTLTYLDKRYDRIVTHLKEVRRGREDVPGVDSEEEQSEVTRGLDTVAVFSHLSDMRKVDINELDEDLGTDGSVFD